MNKMTKMLATGVVIVLLCGVVTSCYGQIVATETWVGGSTASESWIVGTNWSPDSNYPSGIGAGAILNGPDAARTITLNAQITLGSMVVDNTTTFNTTIPTAGAGLNFLWDAVDAGPATITVNGTGGQVNTAGRITIGVTSTLVDNMVVTVNQTNGASTTGGLEWTGAIAAASTGGLTKQGPGTMSLTSGAKNYTGPTVFDTNSGRTRISQVGRPSATSSLTVKSGAQLEPISAGNYAFGTGPLNLNGTGIAAFPGVIRPSTNLAITIPNATVLESDSTVHVQGSATGSLTFTGIMSGPGRFTAGAAAHDANLGQIVLGGTNSYAGGTTVNGGSLVAATGSTTALGTGNVTVESANLVFAGSAAKLLIQSGATNAIADTATLSLAGGNVVGVADDGYAELDGGINETIAGLVLGGVTKAPGIYGSSSSGAPLANQFDEFFSGSGTVTVLAPAVLAGDYNNNGVVDAADYVLWRNGGPLQNDPIGPPIGPAQYDQWKANFGKPVSGVGSSNGLGQVPEPTTIAMVGLLITGLLVGRREK